MNPTGRTIVFVVVALVSLGLAFSANQFTKPAKLSKEYERFGEAFFPDFTDPGKASALRVVSFNDELAAAKEFTVVNTKDGWRIKSHNDYPADGKDQLAKVAASVISLQRKAIVSHRETDHERFGVIDPLDEKNPTLKGRGSRITLFEKGETALADFIIGNKVQGSEDKRYVRRADEKTVYMLDAKFEITTKFADWAETDLLKVSAFDVLQMKGSRPKFNADEELEGVDVVELQREKSDAPWKLVGLDEATEELKTDDVTTMVSTLDDLKLVGVRSKPSLGGKPILSADLKLSLPAELRSNPDIVQQAQQVLISSLKEKGFVVARDDEGNRLIASKEGELLASTREGVVYRLTFGSAFSGTDEDLEIGRNEETKPDAAKDKADDSSKADEKKSTPKGTETKGRYLFVRAEFDEKLLGDKPVEPVKPEPPPGVDPIPDTKPDDKKPEEKKEEKSKTEDTDKKSDSQKESTTDKDSATEDSKCGQDADDKKSPTEKPATEEKPKDEKPKTDSKEPAKKDDATKKPDDDSQKDDNAKKEDKPTAQTKEEPKVDLKAQYQEALKKYDTDKGKYAAELAAYGAKIETGKNKVKELNDRFADWYYVISNDSFDKLRINRSELVKKKLPMESDEKKPESSDSKDADANASKKPGSEKPADSEKTNGDKPADKTDKAEADSKK